MPGTQQVQRGAGLGILDPQQHLAGANRVAIADQDLADNAAFQMLDRLAVGVDGDDAGRDGGAL